MHAGDDVAAIDYPGDVEGTCATGTERVWASSQPRVLGLTADGVYDIGAASSHGTLVAHLLGTYQ